MTTSTTREAGRSAAYTLYYVDRYIPFVYLDSKAVYDAALLYYPRHASYQKPHSRCMYAGVRSPGLQATSLTPPIVPRQQEGKFRHTCTYVGTLARCPAVHPTPFRLVTYVSIQPASIPGVEINNSTAMQHTAAKAVGDRAVSSKHIDETSYCTLQSIVSASPTPRIPERGGERIGLGERDQSDGEQGRTCRNFEARPSNHMPCCSSADSVWFEESTSACNG